MMRVTQNNGKALPVFSFTERQITEKYKQFTGLESIVLTLMGPHDMLLEFDKKADVISSSQKIHGLKTWDSMGVNISCIMSPQKSKFLEIFSSSQKRKKEKLELQKGKEILQKEKVYYEEKLNQAVQQMTEKLDQLDKKIEDVPLIPLGIITPELNEAGSPRGEIQQVVVSAPQSQLVMSLELPLFLGSEPTLTEEGTYKQWRFQVKGMRSSCHTVQSALISSVRGQASKTVSFLGFNAPIGAIMEAMEKHLGKRPTSDKLQQEFFQLQQEKGE